MDWLLIAMAAFILVQQYELVMMKRRLSEVEDTTSAVRVLVEDVNELQHDFYGPEAK